MMENNTSEEEELPSENIGDILELAQAGKLVTAEGGKISPESVRFMQYILEKEKELGHKLSYEEIEEQKKLLTDQARIIVDGALENKEISRSKLGICKNDGCYNQRRFRSAYCQECSDRWRGEIE